MAFPAQNELLDLVADRRLARVGHYETQQHGAHHAQRATRNQTWPRRYESHFPASPEIPDPAHRASLILRRGLRTSLSAAGAIRAAHWYVAVLPRTAARF